MRQRLIWVFISTICALFLVACGGTSVTEFASPDNVRCATSVSTPISTVAASGGRMSVTVTSARECSWTASSDSTWMQVSPTTGQGEAPITLTIAQNTVASPRTATLIVNNARVSVPQEAAPCKYSLDSTRGTIGADGGGVSIRVSATSGCSWTAASHDAWVHVQTSSGSGSGTVALAVDANTGSSRSSAVTIAGLTFTVLQDAYVPPPVAPAPGPVPGPAPGPGPAPSPAPSPSPSPSPSPDPSPVCVYTLSSYSKDFSRKGGGGDFTVNTSQDCAWSASASASWITITSGASGVGPGDVHYSVDHDDGPDRVGIISVAGQTYTITQKGN